MRKIVLSGAVLLGLLLIGSTSLAENPGKVWWTAFTSDVFTLSEEGSYEYALGDLHLTLEVDEGAPSYRGAVLLRPWTIRVRTDEPGLNCADVDMLIRPGQPGRFHVIWITDEPMSPSDAEALFDSLSVSFTVSWDDEPVSLEWQAINPYREGIDWVDASCIWTVRP